MANNWAARVLVTGGAGFIGSHLVEWLVRQGHRVRVLDNLSTGRSQNLGAVMSGIDFCEGDICDFGVIQRAVNGCELVFHLAALVSVAQSVEQPLRAQAVNADGTLHVLEAARQAGVRRVVQASSSAVYGNPSKLPVCESDPVQPLSPYAATKLAAEQLGQLYMRLYGLETVALRFFNVYGPRQDPNSSYAAVVPRFMEALRNGRQPVIYGDGGQTRDFVFVGDVARALWTAGTAPGLGGKVFNVGRCEAISVLGLADVMGKLLKVEARPLFAPARSGEVRHSLADVTSFAQLGGFRARAGLEDGLARIIAELEPVEGRFGLAGH
jgi:UDP-glucose 4-epimerase